MRLISVDLEEKQAGEISILMRGVGGGQGSGGQGRAGEGNTALYCLLSHSGDLLNELTEEFILFNPTIGRKASQCLC